MLLFIVFFNGARPSCKTERSEKDILLLLIHVFVLKRHFATVFVNGPTINLLKAPIFTLQKEQDGIIKHLAGV